MQRKVIGRKERIVRKLSDVPLEPDYRGVSAGKSRSQEAPDLRKGKPRDEHRDQGPHGRALAAVVQALRTTGVNDRRTQGRLAASILEVARALLRGDEAAVCALARIAREIP
jgi:hypothetical protein